MEREYDLDVLWDDMEEDDFGDDERMPYWAELWPASLLLGEWLDHNRNLIAGRNCLELGCGMGLTAIIAAAAGARVTAMDYEFRAVRRARANADINSGPSPNWITMDWRAPALKPASFDFIWGADILYESRFHAPLTDLFRSLLAPGGVIWLGEPLRRVSAPVWKRLERRGFIVHKVLTEKAPFEQYKTTVNIWEVAL